MVKVVATSHQEMGVFIFKFWSINREKVLLSLEDKEVVVVEAEKES